MNTRFAATLTLLCTAATIFAQVPGGLDKPRVATAPRDAIRSGAYLELGPLLGDVTATSAQVWLKASTNALLSVVVGEKENLSDRIGFKAPPLDAAFFSTKVPITGLKPSTRYYYAVLIGGELATPRPYASFTTAPANGASTRQRFAFASCVGYSPADAAPTWADMSTRTNFDLLLMLGDNHYGDTTDPVKHMSMYSAQRRLPGYSELCRRVPQYAIWDNHDFAPAPADSRVSGKERSLQAFQTAWPNPAFGERDNPGVYYKFTRGDIDFFMLDGRYHRDANNAPDEGKKTHLGEKQLAWLKRELLASKARVKVLATGGEWQTHSQPASWASFLRERNYLFKFIEDNGITGIMLVSGDRHFTAAYQVAGRFIEVTSGPVGSKTIDPKSTPEMWWNGGRTGRFYCVLDVDTRAEKPQVTLEVYRTGDGLVLRRPFTWDEVLGQTAITPVSNSALPPGGSR